MRECNTQLLVALLHLFTGSNVWLPNRDQVSYAACQLKTKCIRLASAMQGDSHGNRPIEAIMKNGLEMCSGLSLRFHSCTLKSGPVLRFLCRANQPVNPCWSDSDCSLLGGTPCCTGQYGKYNTIPSYYKWSS
jgi:hypothetical protein